MTIPTWIMVLGCILLYALVGVVEAVVMNFRAGRRGRGGLDGPEGVGLIFLWPIINIVMLVIWLVDKYDDFLRSIRKRGAESIMPPENEGPGRRIS